MHSFTDIHESRNLKQARPYSQYVDLLRFRARYSLTSNTVVNLSRLWEKVKKNIRTQLLVS